jgi:enoyl-[acyl-carrier protein] reductase II
MNSASARVAELCGLEYPIFQAGMGGQAGPELAAAVSEAGGLGHLGGIRLGAAQLRAWIRETRDRTTKPFGVNLVPTGGGPDGFRAQMAVVLEERPKVLSLFWGDFTAVIPAAKAAGIVTMVQVGSVAEARKAVAYGADVIVAQGVEAGGHVRGTIGLFALLPAVLGVAGTRPVLAAGGIADGSGLLGVLEMGAAGAWIGTRFLASNESLAHSVYKERLLAAGADDPKYSRLYSYGWRFGTPHRAILGHRGISPLRLVAGGPRNCDSERYARSIRVYAGQGVGLIHEILPAAEIVSRLMARDVGGNSTERRTALAGSAEV